MKTSFFPQSPGSSSTPGPLWTYVAGGSIAPASGTLTTDSANPSSAWSLINFSLTSKAGSSLAAIFSSGFPADYASYILQNTTTGRSYGFICQGGGIIGSAYQMVVEPLTAFTSFDAGDYTIVSFADSLQAVQSSAGGSTTAGDLVVFADSGGLLVDAAKDLGTVLAPGTYTLGLGVGSNGTITLVFPGIISSVQEAS